jgi:hypothetical protein
MCATVPQMRAVEKDRKKRKELEMLRWTQEPRQLWSARFEQLSL